MRVSSYNIGARLSDQRFYLLLHGYTGAVDKMAAPLGRFLVENRGQSCDPDSGTLGAQPRAVVAELERRGYLTTLDDEAERQAVCEIAGAIHERDLREARTGFMFVPSYACNLRCPYCFQSHEMHSGRGKYGALLDREHVDDAFRVIDDYARPGSVAAALGVVEASTSTHEGRLGDIGLFGGEPLTAETLAIVTHIVECATARGRAVSAISNGVELEKFGHLLGPGMLEEIQITLDGTGPIHDRRRVGPNFRRTFNTISDNIDLALRADVRVSLRMNVDATNAAEIEKLDEYCAQRGWKADPNFRASAAAVTPEGNHERLISHADLVRLTSALNRRHREGIESYENYAYDLIGRALSGNGYPFQKMTNCSAETGLLIFDPFGDVYACWEEIGTPSRRMATYGQQGLTLDHDVAKRWLGRFPGAIEQCTKCPYAFIHTSGCANHARNESGTLFASACESFQEYFPGTLARAYEEFERSILKPKEQAHGG